MNIQIHDLLCRTCRVRLNLVQSSVKVQEMSTQGCTAIRNASLYRCPWCGFEIVTSFAPCPIAQSCDETFEAYLEISRTTGNVQIFGSLSERMSHERASVLQAQEMKKESKGD